MLSTIVLAGTVPGAAGAAETVGEAIRESKWLADWRIRYEGVDQAGFDENADALTSRLRAGFQTGEVARTTLLVEADWVADLVGDYNSTTNGKTQYPVVPDPAGYVTTNRLALTNQSLDRARLTFGRQRVILDDSRFVGNVGWRQHEQTFDGLRAELGNDALKADLAYVVQVNRVLGPDSAAGSWDGDVVLGHLSRQFAWGTLTGFAYLLDLDDAPALSTDTVGLRLTGSKPIGSASRVTGTYALSYARQADSGANPADFAEDYYLAEGGLTVSAFSFALGIESLGGDGANAVTMPLSTLHAFQGWADQFLATPANGIDDAYLKLGYRVGRMGRMQSLVVQAVYHDFDAGVGGAAYGDEIDLLLVARTERLAWTLKYAAYDADTWAGDTDKLWLSVDYSL